MIELKNYDECCFARPDPWLAITAAAPGGYRATVRTLDLIRTSLIVNGKFP
jgi:hypothetical protein